VLVPFANAKGTDDSKKAHKKRTATCFTTDYRPDII